MTRPPSGAARATLKLHLSGWSPQKPPRTSTVGPRRCIPPYLFSGVGLMRSLLPFVLLFGAAAGCASESDAPADEAFGGAGAGGTSGNGGSPTTGTGAGGNTASAGNGPSGGGAEATGGAAPAGGFAPTGGGGTNVVQPTCSAYLGDTCSDPDECCDNLHCLDDGTGKTCVEACAELNAECQGPGQGTCCSPLLVCNTDTHTCLAAACNSATTDCDADGWLVSEGDCCDKPGACGSEPEKVNPGALEVVGNGLDDNCNGKTDLFDIEDTLSCDDTLEAESSDPFDLARALGICRLTLENPPTPKQKTWGLIEAHLILADGSEGVDPSQHRISKTFGSVVPSVLEGSNALVLSTGIAGDGSLNGGAPDGFNVSSSFLFNSVSLASDGETYSVSDWYALPNPPLKPANGLPDSPGCSTSNDAQANDSVMLVLKLRAPTNARAFSFNSYFFSAEYPEFVCTDFNDQFIALVDTPTGVPSPIPNPADKNLMTYSDGTSKWPIGINIAHGTNLFSVCEPEETAGSCWDDDVGAASCSLGSAQLEGTGFEIGSSDDCQIGGGTFWLTTAGNVVPGEIVEIRIAIWDAGDSSYDSLAIIDGFQWLANATLPGTGG